ncbi:glycerophosphodiester phosphodiesterase family protein [Georgenia alba]|uniref:Glycerophosphodiester phosphodiesterase family protein n=1 Tax=Georgenia alba TaxID=2233858 RepID=A0ABW2QBG5_9MICO
MTVRHLRTAATIAAAALATATLAAPSAAEDLPDIIGHRGSAGTAPENTVPSMRDARTAGSELFEIDLQLSSDGVPFLFHDATPGRTTDVEDVFPERADDHITSFTWDELSRLDAGSYFGTPFDGTRIPHLDAAARQARGSTGVNIEVKEPAASPGVEQVLAESLATDPDWQRLLRQDKLVVSSFDVGSLEAFHELAPHVPVLPIVSELPDDETLASWAEYAGGVVTDYRNLEAADVDRVHALGLDLATYTVNDPESMQHLTDLGVDRIITDFPRVLARMQAGQDPVPAANGIEVADVVADVPGADLQPETGEHVVLTNTSDEPVDVSGYLLQDAAINRLTVGEGYVLRPGAELRVYTGPGTNAEDAYYNDLDANVLNNAGDSIAVLSPDPARVLLDLYGY